jgi:hypothetical protein
MMPETTAQPARRPATVNSPVDRTRQPDTSAIKAMQTVTSTTPSIIPYCTLPIPVYEVPSFWNLLISLEVSPSLCVSGDGDACPDQVQRLISVNLRVVEPKAPFNPAQREGPYVTYEDTVQVVAEPFSDTQTG